VGTVIPAPIVGCRAFIGILAGAVVWPARRSRAAVAALLVRTMPGVPRYGAIAAIFGDIYFAERGRGSSHAAAGVDCADATRLRCSSRPLAEAVLNVSTGQSGGTANLVAMTQASEAADLLAFPGRSAEDYGAARMESQDQR